MLKWLEKTAIVCDNIARRMEERGNGAGANISLLHHHAGLDILKKSSVLLKVVSTSTI